MPTEIRSIVLQTLTESGSFKSSYTVVNKDYDTNLEDLARWAHRMHISLHGHYSILKAYRKDGCEDRSYRTTLSWSWTEV